MKSKTMHLVYQQNKSRQLLAAGNCTFFSCQMAFDEGNWSATLRFLPDARNMLTFFGRLIGDTNNRNSLDLCAEDVRWEWWLMWCNMEQSKLHPVCWRETLLGTPPSVIRNFYLTWIQFCVGIACKENANRTTDGEDRRFAVDGVLINKGISDKNNQFRRTKIFM